MRHFKFTTRPIHSSDNSRCNIEYIIQRKIRQQEHIVTSILATPLFFRWKRFFILRTMKKKGVWCYKQLQWQMKVVFLYLFARYGGECPHLVEHILHGEIRTTQSNFLWLLRTNDEALCLYVWVAHLALDANNLCVHMYESAFFCVPVGKPIYFCAICVSIYILAPCDVCVWMFLRMHNPWKFVHVCTFVPSVCLACCERWRRFCSSDTATVSCRHIQSRRNHYTMFSVIN